MKIHGRCFCGQVSYEAEVDPDKVQVCHCTDCQAFSGSPWRASAFADAATVKFSGEPAKIFVKTAASGRPRAQGFCANCGSALFSTTPEDRKLYAFRLGAIAERAQLPPKQQVWCDSALPWASDIRELPKR
ncbi:MAG TPA: GFA family protein [Kofleriaceae bacterium]